MSRRIIALIAAAGQGTRLGAEVPKAFVDLDGASLLVRSVQAFAASGVVDEIIITVSPDMESVARQQVAGLATPVTIVHGGGTRAESVWAGVQSVAGHDAVVLIHDAARALTPPEMIARVALAVGQETPAVIPVLPVADTIKSVEGAVVTGTPSRAQLRAVQTPQGFLLTKLHAANVAYFTGTPEFEATDDASLMEWFGVPVTTVAGDPLAFKITTPIDLTLAKAVLAELKAKDLP